MDLQITVFIYDPVHTGSNRLASNSSKMLHLGARAHGQLVCAAVLSSGGKLGDASGQLLYEAQLLGVKTLCRRSFSPQLFESSEKFSPRNFYNVNTTFFDFQKNIEKSKKVKFTL